MMSSMTRTGRRVNAICHLRASDILLSPEAITRARAAHGQDPGLIRFVPHGAIRWRAEYDKLDYEDIAPISAPARTAIECYLTTMKLSYQQADPATTLRAIENEPESASAETVVDTVTRKRRRDQCLGASQTSSRERTSSLSRNVQRHAHVGEHARPARPRLRRDRCDTGHRARRGHAVRTARSRSGARRAG